MALSPGPHLPPEIFDHIVDFLHDQNGTLKKCCIVSKSWIPRARKHLFAHIRFKHSADLGARKKAFSDPSKSPAHHTRRLDVTYLCAVTDGEEGGWIRSFANIEGLTLSAECWGRSGRGLTHFHHISFALTCLYILVISLSSSQVCDLICSFPLLQDLVLIDGDDYEETPGEKKGILRSSTSPVLNGTLVIFQMLMRDITPRLLNLPNGLDFWRIVCESQLEEDLLRLTALVKACSDTLDVVDVNWWGKGRLFPLGTRNGTNI